MRDIYTTENRKDMVFSDNLRRCDMSRIGRLPVEIPAGVEVTVAEKWTLKLKIIR